jgi:acetyltransferase
MYLEDLSAGRQFIEVAREITGDSPNSKPILAIKSGRTPEGAKAASSHTGSLAGSDEVYDAIFSQAGVLRVDTVDELFDYALAFADEPLPKGRRVGILTNAGGAGIMTTDACIRLGLEIPRLTDATVEEMRPFLPLTSSLRNPVDVIGDARDDRYEVALKAMVKDPNIDSIITLATPQSVTNLPEIADVIGRVGKTTDKPILTCFMGVVDITGGLKVLEQHGMVHYRFPEAAARSLAKMVWYSEWKSRPRTEVKTFTADREAAEKVIAQARSEGRLQLSQSESLEVFEAYGLPVPPFSTAATAEEAKAAAEKIGYPIAMKILSNDISHKFDVGGVKLSLESAEDVEQAFKDMLQTVGANCPDAKLDGALLQRMVPKGTETIIGMKRDKQFGPVVMFGLGGTFVEAFKDVTFRLAPVRELGAQHMVESIRAHKLLEGFRGQPPADLAVVVECIERVSQLSLDLDAVDELDANPLIVYPRGQGAAVADARLVLKPAK